MCAVDLEEGASALQDILPGILANRTDILKHYSTQSSVHLFNLISITAVLGWVSKENFICIISKLVSQITTIKSFKLRAFKASYNSRLAMISV